MRLLRTIVLATILVALMALALPVGAQSETSDIPTATFEDAAWDTSFPGLTCLTFTLILENVQNMDILISGYPYYDEGEGFILNMSGDEFFSTENYFIVDEYLFEGIHLDDIVWDHQQGNGMFLCAANDHLPYSENSLPYEWAMLVEVTDFETGEVIASFDSQYDAALPNAVYETPLQAARTSNFEYEFQDDGVWVRFTLEVLGFQDQEVRVAMYILDYPSLTPVIASSLLPLNEEDGNLVFQDVVVPSYQYAIWADWFGESQEASRSFQFFVPNEAIPIAIKSWIPYVVLSDEGNEVIHQNLARERDVVYRIKDSTK